METAVLRSAEELEALGSEWNGLQCRMALPEIFYRWEWSWCFYRHFRHDVPLCVVTVRNSGRLVGLAPLCITSRTRIGRRVRVLEPIIGNLADYRNLLVDNTVNRRRVVRALLTTIDALGSEWDVAEFRELPSRDITTLQLISWLPELPGVRYGLRVASRTATLTYASDFERKGDAKQIRWIRNKQRQLERERGLEIRIGEAGDDDFWPQFFALHEVRWPGSPLHTPAGRRFLDDLRQRLAPLALLECSRLVLDGRTAAMHFGFKDARKVYYYMPVMAQEFKRDRVGNILTLALVDHYARTHQEFDFLRGDEQYKLWWTDDASVNFRLRLHRRSSFSAFADQVMPATKEYIRSLALPGYLAGRLRSRPGAKQENGT